MLSDQLETKAVNSADLGGLEKREQLSNPCRLLLFFESLFQADPDTLTHLRCGGLREGDHQNILERDRWLLFKEAGQTTFNERACLACPRACDYEHVSAGGD